MVNRFYRSVLDKATISTAFPTIKRLYDKEFGLSAKSTAIVFTTVYITHA